VRTAHAASIDTSKLASRLRLRCDGDHKNALLRVTRHRCVPCDARESRTRFTHRSASVLIRHHAEGSLPECRQRHRDHDQIRRRNLRSATEMNSSGACASKYGALSVPAGKIMIRWDFTPKSVHLSWRERDGSTVKSPAHPGFGRIIIERMATDVFGGAAELELLPTGVHWSASIPRSFIVGSAA
jgi:hypothetical protein